MKDFHNLTHKIFFNGMESLTLSGRGSSFKGFFLFFIILFHYVTHQILSLKTQEIIIILYIGRVSHFENHCVLVEMVFQYSSYFPPHRWTQHWTTTTISHTSKPFSSLFCFISVLQQFFFYFFVSGGKVKRLHNLFLLI